MLLARTPMSLCRDFYLWSHPEPRWDDSKARGYQIKIDYWICRWLCMWMKHELWRTRGSVVLCETVARPRRASESWKPSPVTILRCTGDSRGVLEWRLVWMWCRKENRRREKEIRKFRRDRFGERMFGFWRGSIFLFRREPWGLRFVKWPRPSRLYIQPRLLDERRKVQIVDTLLFTLH